MSNAPSKPVSFSRPKVGYFSNRPRIWQGFYAQKILYVHSICFSRWTLQCVISLGNLNGFCGIGSIISSGGGGGSSSSGGGSSISSRSSSIVAVVVVVV